MIRVRINPWLLNDDDDDRGGPAKRTGKVPPERLKLTKSVVEKLPHPELGQRFFFDRELKGFGIRVGKTAGVKTYFVERDVKGRGVRRRIDIGRHGPTTAEHARDEAKRLIGLMANGIDPVDEKRKEMERQEAERLEREEKERGCVTLKHVWEEFQREVKLKEKTLRDYSNYINGVFAKWMERGIDSITQADVKARHQELGDKGHTYYANGAMRVLSSVLGYAVEEGYLAVNPVQVLRGRGRRGRERKRGRWYEEKRRDSVIKPGQLPGWFKALDAVREMTEPKWTKLGCDYLEFVLFTGLRKEEAASLRWSDVDSEAETFTVADTKNGDPHTLPLTSHLVTILERRKKAAGDSPWVFPTPAVKKKGKGYLADPRAVVELVEKASGITFMVYDLRRTFATTAESLDISYLSVKRLLNHRINMKQDVTAGYVVADLERLRDCMQRVTDVLLTYKAKAASMKIAQ